MRTKIKPKTVDLEKFSIQIPGTWNAVKQQGYNSYVEQIEINDKEKVTFDLGWYSNKLNIDPATHDIYFITIDNKRAKVVTPKTLDRERQEFISTV